MSDRLTNLIKEKKINKIEYLTYVLFVGNDVGCDYLKRMVESSFMEEAIAPVEDNFAWLDGRKSTWRDIKLMINKVNSLLEGKNVRGNE